MTYLILILHVNFFDTLIYNPQSQFRQDSSALTYIIYIDTIEYIKTYNEGYV